MLKLNGKIPWPEEVNDTICYKEGLPFPHYLRLLSVHPRGLVGRRPIYTWDVFIELFACSSMTKVPLGTSLVCGAPIQ